MSCSMLEFSDAMMSLLAGLFLADTIYFVQIGAFKTSGVLHPPLWFILLAHVLFFRHKLGISFKMKQKSTFKRTIVYSNIERKRGKEHITKICFVSESFQNTCDKKYISQSNFFWWCLEDAEYYDAMALSVWNKPRSGPRKTTCHRYISSSKHDKSSVLGWDVQMKQLLLHAGSSAKEMQVLMQKPWHSLS